MVARASNLGKNSLRTRAFATSCRDARRFSGFNARIDSPEIRSRQNFSNVFVWAVTCVTEKTKADVPQIGESPLDSGVSPSPVLLRHANGEIPNHTLNAGTPRPTPPAPILLLSDQVAVP